MMLFCIKQCYKIGRLCIYDANIEHQVDMHLKYAFHSTYTTVTSHDRREIPYQRKLDNLFQAPHFWPSIMGIPHCTGPEIWRKVHATTSS